MIGGHDDIRPLLAARSGELSSVQARWVADHLVTCQACTVEAATYQRLFRGLATMAQVEIEPPDGLLERLLATVTRRRHGALVVAAAAGSAGALVATVVVARALQQRRRSALLQLAKPAHNAITAVLAPAAAADLKNTQPGKPSRWWRLRPA